MREDGWTVGVEVMCVEGLQLVFHHRERINDLNIV